MINVALISDTNYVLPTLTAIQSVILNSKTKTNIHVILTSEYSDDTESFEKLSTEEVSVNVIKMENPFDVINASHVYVSKSALIKFLLPNIFSNLDKILYIDGDTLILDDLSEIFNTNLEDKYAAVVEDFQVIKQQEHLPLNLSKYFNSGVMVLNLKKLREDNISDKLIEYKKNETISKYMDQNSFNSVFNENVIYLNPKNNLINVWFNEKTEFPIEDLATFYNLTVEEMSSVAQNPTILHMAGGLKPWENTNSPEFRYWIKYFLALPVELQTKYLLKNLNKYRKTNAQKIENLQKQINEKNSQILNLQNKLCNAENDISNLHNSINSLSSQTESLNIKLKKIEEKTKNTFLSKIFSLKNEYCNNSKHKVITILGIKIKFRKK